MIFVDVDGTLIDEHDRPNAWVVAAVWKLLAAGVHPVVIWSGGGQDYAEMWSRRLFPSAPVGRAIAKDPSALREHDIIVDDQLEFAVPAGCRLFTPEAFAAWVFDD